MASVNKRSWTHKGQKKEAWVVRYFDAKGAHRQRTFERKKDADGFKRTTENEIADGVHIAASEAVTVAQMCEAYLRSEEHRLRDKLIGKSHYRRVRCNIDYSIAPFLGKRLANELQSTDIEDWYQQLRRERKLAADTARDRVKELGRIFDYGIRRKMVMLNPVTVAAKQLRGIARGTIKVFTKEQVAMLLKAANEKRRGQHERAFMITRIAVHLAAFCGLRFGEIMGLTVNLIDFSNRVIEVRHSLTDWDELKAPKTVSGIRDIPMPEHIAVLLSAWLRDYHRPDERGLIFRTPKGNLIDAASFHASYWGPLLKAAGLHSETDRFHFHALRHFAASWMIAHGLPMMDVASLMGHKKFDITLQVYAHSIVGGKRRSELFDKMATGLLSGKSEGSEILLIEG